MSESPTSPSVWNIHDENDDHAPKYCPHCGDEIAHPDSLRENEDISVSGRFGAYRQHRGAHFNWGVDPATIYPDGDPYLADYYEMEPEGEDGPSLDPHEEVAGIYQVEINYEAVLRATVVATNKHQAKERVENLKLNGDTDLNGNVPEPRVQHQLHDTTREMKKLTRKQIQESSDDGDGEDDEDDGGVNYAERLPGWPW
jgi:hypothetical protein